MSEIPVVEQRRFKHGDSGSFGRVLAKGREFTSLELPWRENQRNKSCIPPGRYLCTWTYSNRFKREMYEVTGVSGRVGVRLHKGNWAGDTEKGLHSDSHGCPMYGKDQSILIPPGMTEPQAAISASRLAMQEFEDLMGKEDFYLDVIDETGGQAGGEA
jgi:allophanate hydrolase subunit 2